MGYIPNTYSSPRDVDDWIVYLRPDNDPSRAAVMGSVILQESRMTLKDEQLGHGLSGKARTVIRFPPAQAYASIFSRCR